MNKKSKLKTDQALLRIKAEEMLRKKTPEAGLHFSEAEMLKFFHEIQVHQIELELQNEELIRAKEKAETAVAKYTEIFDFASSSHFTLSKEGEIIDLNLSASQMLGKERSHLKNSRFGFFVSDDTRPIFNSYLDKVFNCNTKVTCELTLTGCTNLPRYVLLTGIAAGEKEYCFVAVADITELKQSENALRENNSKLEFAMQAANMAWWEMDAVSGKVSFSNKKAEMLGYPPEKFKHYKDFTDLLHPEDYDKAMKAMQSHINGTIDKYEIEYRIHTKCGEYKWFYDIGSIVKRDSKGSPLYITGLVFDISDRMLAEEALKESEQKYRELVENSPDAILIHVEGNIVLINKECLRLMALESAGELIGKPVLQFVHPDFRELVIGRMKAAVNEEVVLPLTVEKFIRPDGSELDVEVKAIPVRFDSKPAVQLIVRDITERKKDEEKLRELHRRLESIIEGTHVGTWEWNVHTGEAVYNEEWERIIGYKLDELHELAPLSFKTWENYTHTDDIKHSNEMLQRHFAGELPYYDCECRMKHKDGHWVWVQDRGRVITRTADGKPLMMFGTHTDITERKLAQEEINSLNTELEQRIKQRTSQLENANLELEAFSYSVAHNLRSPLRGIDGWSLALLEDYNKQLDEQGRLYLRRVRIEAQHMGDLIDDLLKLLHITHLEMRLVNMDLTALVQIIANRFVEFYPDRKFEFSIEPGVLIVFDPAMLEILITNLLDNACKFSGTRDLAEIEFGLQQRDGGSTYFIRDNGVGFDMEYSKNLFTAFQRMHKQSDFPGSGIGLATVKRIISRHGGKIWAESKPGEGATFYFTVGEEEKS